MTRWLARPSFEERTAKFGLRSGATFALRLVLPTLSLALDYAWWWFLILFLVPDISMLGYLFGPKAGAWIYDTAHHKGLAIALFVLGSYSQVPWLQFAGLIILGHSSFDRMLGYGLRFTDSFQHTHLGTIGR